MTIQDLHSDAHHDLTWLTAAVARAMFVQGGEERRVLYALEKLAACDLATPPSRLRHATATACHWLPEALTAALAAAEEVAMALAAAHEHLFWRPVAEAQPHDAATWTSIVGPDAPLPATHCHLRVLLTAPQVRLPVIHDAPALLLVLSGEAAFRDEHGALRHLVAGQLDFLPASTHLMSVSRTPMLAALLQA